MRKIQLVEAGLRVGILIVLLLLALIVAVACNGTSVYEVDCSDPFNMCIGSDTLAVGGGGE
jgi:hypothetical protein